MSFFDKYGVVLVSIIAGIFSIGFMLAVFDSTSLGSPVADFVEVGVAQDTTSDNARVDYDLPEVQITVENGILNKGQTFNYKDYIAVSINGVTKDEYKEYVTMIGNVDTSSTMEVQTVTFRFYWNGIQTEQEATFYVRDKI